MFQQFIKITFLLNYRIERITTTDCFIDNIYLPKDTVIVIPIWALHLDPDNFEEPDTFKPERFLPENQENIKDCTYMPFATGPRNCIGMRLALMEIKHFVVKILIKFRFEATQQTNVI